MYRKRHLPAAVAAACLLLTAAACDGTPEGRTSTAPTTAPSLTPTPSPTRSTPAPPTVPPAALKGLTVTSAEAFARFYVAALDYAAATGDVRLLRQWQEKGCENCRSVAQLYENSYRAGGGITGQLGTRITETTEARLIRNDGAVVVFKTMAGRTSLRTSATSSPTVLPGGPGLLDFTLAARGGHWTVFEVEVSE